MYNVLVLYNGQSMFTPTVQDYLDAFRRYSSNNIHFMHVDHQAKPAFSFDDYDVLIITYSCRLCYLELMSPHVRSAVAAFRGLKVALAQDEYQETNKLRDGIRELGVKLFFTCVPEDKIAWVYPPEALPGVRIRRVLTGYVPQRLSRIPWHKLPPTRSRDNWIGYRGRHIGHRFGDLAYYKVEIGRQFKRACDRRSVPHDIAWTEDARIYQDRWFPFILSCRATLGTPSGSNVFDWDGGLERELAVLMKENPDLDYATYRPRIAAKEAEIDMGQVSPRVFEAAALGTVLVLLEGSYSDVMRPGEDCIIVKSDFSNVDSVLDQLGDVEHVAAMAKRAHHNIIESGRWNYDTFIALIDDEIAAMLDSRSQASQVLDVSTLVRRRAADQSLLETLAQSQPEQFALSNWLDVSHLRDKTVQHTGLMVKLAPAQPPPAITAPAAASVVDSSVVNEAAAAPSQPAGETGVAAIDVAADAHRRAAIPADDAIAKINTAATALAAQLKARLPNSVKEPIKMALRSLTKKS